MDRRSFIAITAAGIGAASLGLYRCTNPHQIPPSDWLNIGIIGVGNRGQHMMRMLLRVPGVRITGLCDVNERRFAEGRKVTGEETRVYSDHRKMLEARDIDAVLVATPLGLHADHVVAGLESGRPVYGEKSLGRTVEDCDRIREAAKKSGKCFQVGLQYTYAPWYQEALQRIRDGKIGQVTHIYAYWHRNNNWRRPVPKDSGLERLLNWRLYKQWSGGLLAELGSHQISIANTVFGTLPESVVASGGIDFWKDGREIEDNIQVTYRYPGGRVLQVSYITTNRLDGAQERIFGTGGSVVLTHTEATYYKEPADSNSAVPPEIASSHKLITGPTYSAEQPYTGRGEKPISGKAADADLLACQAFIDCIRQHRRPLADEDMGWSEGVTVALGNKALEMGQRIAFSDYLRSATLATSRT
jgi:predicted dehydrogenase